MFFVVVTCKPVHNLPKNITRRDDVLVFAVTADKLHNVTMFLYTHLPPKKLHDMTIFCTHVYRKKKLHDLTIFLCSHLPQTEITSKRRC